MKIKGFFILTLILCLNTSQYISAKKKKSEKSSITAIAALKTPNDSSAYKNLIKDANTKKGMFTTHFSKTGKLYFEIPDSAFSHTYLLANRIASTSNTQDFVAGQMAVRPLLIRFSKDMNNVYIHKVQTDNVVAESDPISSAFDRNFIDPILKAFKISANNGKNVIIDVSSFFGGNEKCISPIKPENPLSKLFGNSKSIKGSFVSEASSITEVKTFPQNIEIKSSLSFTTQPLNEPYTVLVHRSLLLLPDKPMKMRLQDNRVGFFSSDQSLYTSSKDKVEPYAFIHRWRLEPKAGETEKYRRGELVEPCKPIVFYIDSAFPKKWKIAVKQGVEDWNTAFETAGFKNAIKALDYPINDPNFDPDDMRYSCIKYATTTIANAMGPSFIDPRSGEILTADVIWYHNIISLLHNWRFTQTAAVDPRVRKPVFDDEVMQESMRYVAAHEIGHTLGLMHNMGASCAFPIDSLRSVTFSNKYGTTPSIMDYARNNFVAQPGDFERGVKLTPPTLGVYDIFAINWGYRIIPEANSKEEEKSILDKWVIEKKDDPMYEFGAQQFFGTIDPTDQTEDLGNDHIKAGDMAISNLKIIMQNLETWTLQPGHTYDAVSDMYSQVVKQYSRHLRHVMPYIGGVKFKEVRQGENEPAKTYFNKTEQKQAMLWLLDQARTYNEWLTPPSLMLKLSTDLDSNIKLQSAIVGCLLYPSNLYRIKESGNIDSETNYTLEEYIDDAINEIFKASYQGKKLNETERNLQTAALSVITNYTDLISSATKNASKALSDYSDMINMKNEQSIPCYCPYGLFPDEPRSFLRINFGMPAISQAEIAPIMTARLKKIQYLYKQKKSQISDISTRDFYDYQILKIENLFKQ